MSRRLVLRPRKKGLLALLAEPPAHERLEARAQLRGRAEHAQLTVRHDAHSVAKLVGLLKENHKFREVSIRILYPLSVDDRCKSMFTYTEAIPITMQLVIKFPQDRIARELGALAVNLSLNARNAELATVKKQLQQDEAYARALAFDELGGWDDGDAVRLRLAR